MCVCMYVDILLHIHVHDAHVHDGFKICCTLSHMKRALSRGRDEFFFCMHTFMCVKCNMNSFKISYCVVYVHTVHTVLKCFC